MSDARRPRWLVLRRSVFVIATLVLITATHWPRLRIEAGIARPDLYIHVGAFFVWAGLLIQSCWFGPAWSRRNALVCLPVGLAFAAIDESTQAIPGLGRVPAWDDFAANALGVSLACVGTLAIGSARSR